MSQRDSGLLSAAMVLLDRGQDSGNDPRIIQPNQVALAINATSRGGFLHNRPGWSRIALIYDSEEDQAAVEEGRFQGASFFAPRTGAPCLIASISGRQWRFNIWTDDTVQEVTVAGDPNPSNRLQCWFAQAEDFLIMQDGQSKPWCYNGATARRLGIGELPVGCMMVSALGRVWVTLPDRLSFVAGDLSGSSSGTPAYNYRDAVLKMTENDYLNEGGAFSVPFGSGEINAMAYVPTLDTSLGQGPIEVFVDNGAFSVNAPFDRTTWKNLTYPIQTVSLGSPGSLSQWATPTVNGDLWYRGKDGIRSFIVARRDFTMWGNVPMSVEMKRLLKRDTPWLLPFASAVTFDNRLLMTATPVWDADHGVAHRALAVMDFELISSLGQRTQPCWDGMWTGFDAKGPESPTFPLHGGILQLLTGSWHKVDRCFAFTLSPNGGGVIQLYENLPESSFDVTTLASYRIKWGFESRLYDYGSPNTLKSLERSDLAPSDIMGTVDFSVQFRADENPCWIDWTFGGDRDTFTVCAQDSNCTPEDCWTPDIYNKTYRTRVTLPSPPISCEVPPNKPAAQGFRHQVRWTILGPCSVKQMVLYARDVQQAPFEGCPPSSDVPCSVDTCCPPDNYFQSEI